MDTNSIKSLQIFGDSRRVQHVGQPSKAAGWGLLLLLTLHNSVSLKCYWNRIQGFADPFNT